VNARVIEPIDRFAGDGQRRRSLLLKSGHADYLLEVSWEGSRYEFTESTFDVDRELWQMTGKEFKPAKDWPTVIDRAAHWAAERAKDLL